MKILIIEDDTDLLDFLSQNLPARGFAVDGAKTGSAGTRLALTNSYDLVVIDLNLPDMKGEDVVKEIKKGTYVPPILILTVISSPEAKVRLLNSGADDYMSKPFSFDEFVARLRALLRRPMHVVPDVFVSGNLTVNMSNRTVVKGKTEVTLTRKEFDILEYLIRNRGQTVTKSALVEHIWDSRVSQFIASVETHIANTRRKLGTADIIKTIHGRGYSVR